DATGDGARIQFHHGPVVILGMTVDNTLPAIIDWCREHPSELVIVYLSHCTSGGILQLQAGSRSDESEVGTGVVVNTTDRKCADANFLAPFQKLNVRVLMDSGHVNSMTLAEAKEAAGLERGGMLLGITEDSMNENWDPSITWTGQRCGPGEGPWQKLWGYVGTTLGSQQGTLNQVQSFWQESGTTAELMFWNIIKYNEQSQINHFVLEQIRNGAYEGVNFLEVNNICAHGPEIAEAIGTTVSALDKQRCQAACGSPRYEAECKKFLEDLIQY
ncbi:unnamed protein product, partial [Polarella glacialis]